MQTMRGSQTYENQQLKEAHRAERVVGKQTV